MGWMGGEINDVKTHLLHVGQPCFTVGKGAVALGIVGGRAREKFIPRRKPGTFALDPHRVILGMRVGQAQVGVALGQGTEGGL